MTLERPWAREYDRLVEVLRKDPDGELVADRRRAAADLFFYPEFVCEIDSHVVNLWVSEFPGGVPGFMEAGDNVEYLRVLLRKKSRTSVSISPEGIVEKFQKLVRLRTEPQTGDPEFDRAYLLEAKTPDDEALLARPEFREAVRRLEPLQALIIKPESVVASRMVREADDLEPEAVLEFARRTIHVARILDSH
jgi:hypothetical protein